MTFDQAFWHSFARLVISSAVAAVVIYQAKKILLYPHPERTQSFWVGCFIALEAVVLISLGGVFVVVAADEWAAACMWAGAALFVGAFVGILFGVPFSASTKPSDYHPSHDQEVTLGETGQAKPRIARNGASAQTLLVEAASWFSKFLAGATFAQARNLRVLFVQLSENVGSYLSRNAAHPGSLGGAILLYFFFLGFLSGLLLPSFFLEGF